MHGRFRIRLHKHDMFGVWRKISDLIHRRNHKTGGILETVWDDGTSCDGCNGNHGLKHKPTPLDATGFRSHHGSTIVCHTESEANRLAGCEQTHHQTRIYGLTWLQIAEIRFTRDIEWRFGFKDLGAWRKLP